MVNVETYHRLQQLFAEQQVSLVAVSKIKPAADIQQLYDLGQRDFGENYVQELVEKQGLLPADIRWHFIGHLQTNKVKFIASFVHMVHGVDSFKLLQEIAKQGEKNNRVIDVLLQMHIAEEETKFGLDEKEILELLAYYEGQQPALKYVRICGLMGMATATDDTTVIRQEFARLHGVFRNLQQSSFLGKAYFSVCSMGMSGDYELAIEEGSTMVRIGSMLFGRRS